MRNMLTVLAILFSFLILGQVQVKGYYRSNGTYVQPHVRSSPDGNPYNNWSFPGNTNPYTGKTATGNTNTYLENYYNKSNSSGSDVWVNGYYRDDGTYVSGHWRSAPNSDPYDNWSYPGNTNPYTGKTATGNPATYLENYYKTSYRETSTYYVATERLNVRSGPSTDFEVLTTLDRGARVQVWSSEESDWCMIQTDNVSGYVYGPYLEKDDYTGSYDEYSTAFPDNNYAPRKYVAISTLNVRSGPSTNHSVLTILHRGETVETVSETMEGWVKVRISYYEGNTRVFGYGYVFDEYLSDVSTTFDYFQTSTSQDRLDELFKNLRTVPDYSHFLSEGTLCLWTDCSDDGEIKVFVDGLYKGTVSKYFVEGYPECGDEGTFNLKLRAGRYKIKCAGDSKIWQAELMITGNQCTIKQLSK